MALKFLRTAFYRDYIPVLKRLIKPWTKFICDEGLFLDFEINYIILRDLFGPEPNLLAIRGYFWSYLIDLERQHLSSETNFLVVSHAILDSKIEI